MFDADVFVADCQTALSESQPMLAIKEILDRAITEPDDIAAALDGLGLGLLHRSAELTIANVVVPAGAPRSLPHDHRMWALVGIYGGQEDNQFFRRAEEGLAESGRRSLHISDTLAMGDDTIHAIRNPLAHSALAAIHVYGGDLFGTARSMWTGPEQIENPYDDTKVVGPGGVKDLRRQE